MIPFSPPHIDQQTIDEVVDALRSGWITTGPRTKEFERRLAEYAGVEKVLAVNSATAGLELILRWYGVGPGDEVIIPAYTYCATANVVVHCGATPVMVDSGEDFNMDINAVRQAITHKTKVIIPVDIAGWPCDYGKLIALVNDDEIRDKFIGETTEQQKLNRILLLADAAHSLGAEIEGEKAAAFADVAVFSFHAVKNLTTAEGGAVCLDLPAPFDNEELYKKLNIFSLHGQSKDALAKMQKGNWEYDVVEAGYKYNMPDILAAIGLVELGRYESDILKRRENIVNQYNKRLEGKEWAQLPVFSDDKRRSSFHLYPLRIKNISEQQRNQIIQLIFDKDVSVNVHFKPLPMMTYYKEKGYNIDHFPVAYDNFSREISLPVYYDLTDEQVNVVVEAVISSVEETLNKG